MIVYHGSNLEIRKPDCFHSRRSMDFGPGFYVTPLLEQAQNWTAKFKRKGEPAIVSQYYLDDSAYAEYMTLWFDSYSGEWLDYMCACRQGNDPDEYDMVMGGVANDRVYDTINLYFEGLISRDEALKRLKYYFPVYLLRCRTVAYWRKAYFLQNWMDEHLGGVENVTHYKITEEILEELDTDCHKALNSAKEYERIFDIRLEPDEEWSSVKERLLDTIDQISHAYEEVDWEAGDMLTYYEWF